MAPAEFAIAPVMWLAPAAMLLAAVAIVDSADWVIELLDESELLEHDETAKPATINAANTKKTFLTIAFLLKNVR
ncbi:MAG TPA: hypothetical protein VEJ41_07145 [Candidatus Acidoferrales bacterium]|nr:hypothetical protein [Candidatus Acidoferrales bacterium]